jgi:hypothetical protein
MSIWRGAIVCLLWTCSSAFVLVPTVPLSWSSSLFSLKQRKDESSSDYFLRMQEAARDPKKFEEMSLSIDAEEEETTKPTNGKGYQRIEEWDAETKVDNSWEEKVKFDGLRYGNKVNQNSILTKHLNGF